MAIVRWDPIKDLISIQERVNKIFEDTFEDKNTSNRGEWTPPVDIYETQDELVIIAEIPGMNEEDVDLQISDNVLSLKGVKKLPVDKEKDNFHRLERPYGKFNRSFALPNTLDINSIKASLKDGLLKITFKKKQDTQPTVIKVNKE